MQPIFCPSVLAEMMRPDGSSSIPSSNGEVLSADLAHELMCVQVALEIREYICLILLTWKRLKNMFI